MEVVCTHSESVIIGKETELVKVSNKRLYLAFKRVIDILFGIVGIIIMIPLAFMIKAVSIFNRDYNSIFFKQQRIGKDGKLFTMYKFRTMVPNADQVLEELMKSDKQFRKEYSENKKVKNDPRITKLGKILRRSSLDEIPQFINVFKYLIIDK